MRCRGGRAPDRDRLRRGFGACLRRCAVPAAGGRRDVDRVVGLGLGAKGLDRELGGGERLRVEALCDVVALACRIRVSLCRGEAEPFVGFGEVLLDADAAGIEDAEVVLAVGDATIGSLAEPLRRARVVWAAAAAISIEHRE